MGIELVLNNLSFEPLATDRSIARQRLVGFQRTASAAIRLRANRYIRCPGNIHRHFLATGYSIGDWLDDSDVDIDLRRTIRSWFTKSPYWQDDLNLEQGVNSRMFLFNSQNNAFGLGVTALLNGLAISFLSEDTWNASYIVIKVLTEIIVNNIEADTLDEDLTVRHISQPNHLVEHQDWMEERLAIHPVSGLELWVRRQEWLPRLLFCSSVQTQVEHLTNPMLSSVTRHLVELNQYCESWTDGNFDSSQFPPNRISPESAMTLQQYSAERTKLCPDGIERIFNWHLKMTPLAWRIQIYPIVESKYIIIGYIGRHLRTARFNN